MSQHIIGTRIPRELGRRIAVYLVRIRHECGRMDARDVFSRTYATELAAYHVRIFY